MQLNVIFYVIVILALVGSAYYGWTSAKRAQNRTETREQAHLRQGINLVNGLLGLTGLIFLVSLISGLLRLTGNSQLLEAGLRLIFNSSVTLQTSSQISLMASIVSLLHLLINGGLLVILRRLLTRRYQGEHLLANMVKPLQWAGHLLLLKALISPGIFSLGSAGQSASFFNFGYCLVAVIFYVLAYLIRQEEQ